MKLILATKNEHKVDELEAMLKGFDVELTSLFDHPEIGDIEENGKTFEENSLIKARTIHHITGEWALADDSGLVVDALNGAPGIYSSRYSGREKDYAANNRKILEEMAEVQDKKRTAAFVCVMSLVGPNGFERTVEGRCEGVIARDLKGSGGFGYDPLFYLPSKGKTMAELTQNEKNSLSHRGRALTKIRDVLLEILNKRG